MLCLSKTAWCHFFLNLRDWICWNSLNAIMQHSMPCTTIPHDWVWIWQHTSAALRFLSNVHAHLAIAHVCSLPQQRLARTETQLTAPPKQKNGSKEKHPVLSTRVTKHSVQTPKLPVRECDVRVKVVSNFPHSQWTPLLKSWAEMLMNYSQDRTAQVFRYGLVTCSEFKKVQTVYFVSARPTVALINMTTLKAQ